MYDRYIIYIAAVQQADTCNCNDNGCDDDGGGVQELVDDQPSVDQLGMLCIGSMPTSCMHVCLRTI